MFEMILIMTGIRLTLMIDLLYQHYATAGRLYTLGSPRKDDLNTVRALKHAWELWTGLFEGNGLLRMFVLFCL